MLRVVLLLVAWGAAAISCVRLCLVSVRTGLLPDTTSDAVRTGADGHEPTLYETAFLAGGPPTAPGSGAVLHVLLCGVRGRRRPVPAANPDPNPVSLERRAARNAPAPAV